jgi:hypothetical protein
LLGSYIGTGIHEKKYVNAYSFPAVSDVDTEGYDDDAVYCIKGLARPPLTPILLRLLPSETWNFVDFNAAGLSSGVYYYQLIFGGFVDTKKLVVSK